MPKPSFRLRVVSDQHIRSNWGLWPPNFVYDDTPYPQNRFNRFLWECWEDMNTNNPPADLLVVNGDLDDGEAPLDRGVGVKTADLDVAHQAIIETLRPARERAKQCYLVSGTRYHERWFGAIANAIDAARWPNRSRVGMVLDLAIRGLNVNIAHHPDGGSVLYRGTALDKLGLWSIIAAGVGKVVNSQVIIRSHHHHYGLLQSNGRTVVQTPAFQLQTPYAAKRAYFRYQPDIGFVDLLFTEGEAHPTVIPVLYALPKKEAVRVG